MSVVTTLELFRVETCGQQRKCRFLPPTARAQASRAPPATLDPPGCTSAAGGSNGADRGSQVTRCRATARGKVRSAFYVHVLTSPSAERCAGRCAIEVGPSRDILVGGSRRATSGYREGEHPRRTCFFLTRILNDCCCFC